MYANQKNDRKLVEKERSDMIHARIQEYSSGGRGGGGVQVHLAYKKSSDNFFLFLFFFCSQHILQKSSGYFQRKLSFAKVPVWVEYFPAGGGGGGGGPTFYRGSNCFFPIETQWFSRGSGPPAPPPPPPLWILPCDSVNHGLIYLLVFLFSFSI